MAQAQGLESALAPGPGPPPRAESQAAPAPGSGPGPSLGLEQGGMNHEPVAIDCLSN